MGAQSTAGSSTAEAVSDGDIVCGSIFEGGEGDDAVASAMCDAAESAMLSQPVPEVEIRATRRGHRTVRVPPAILKRRVGDS